jgi:EpsG family
MLDNANPSRERRFFGYLSLLLCVIFAYRPIPALEDTNDTGRYVAFQQDACGSAIADDDSSLQQWTFNVLLRPTCVSRGPRLFLFVVSAALPFALLAFGNWNPKGAVFLAAGFLISVVGFELSTNALRQAVSLAFLLAALSLNGRILRLLALCVAVLLHTSSWIFLPWVFFLKSDGLRFLKVRLRSVLLGISALWLVWYFAAPYLLPRIEDAGTLLEAYNDVYDTEVRLAFLVFMILPVAWVFGVRWADARKNLPRAEVLTFCYSAAVLLVTIAFFPMITYRVAMTAVVLQLFVAMKSNVSARSGAWISSGLVAHFLIYVAISPNVRAVFNV